MQSPDFYEIEAATFAETGTRFVVHMLRPIPLSGSPASLALLWRSAKIQHPFSLGFRMQSYIGTVGEIQGGAADLFSSFLLRPEKVNALAFSDVGCGCRP